ncbi:Crp/Fnr family transcriptional regulator [Sphingomonas aerophila]|jgi:CRP-like cAMP-binding protein|uniref:CRP-like cAMP-binding protein n=1 Tax=Sphingomonas aerophila TaxID=1344948 RepID=A0A7W9BC85_9SPHN|nr:Crp/Fnr family transcriptional regulator [Sphingomonas aerophila]MBB5714358.1 CRP-like cAMP-binding protein [Sphingomonas aerophila]
MGSVLTRYFERLADLDSSDRAALDSLALFPHRHLRAREDSFREGDPCSSVSVLISGWACLSKMTERGDRQIISFVLPGEPCDCEDYLLGVHGVTLQAITDIEQLSIPAERLELAFEDRPKLLLAFRRAGAIRLASVEDRMLTVGRRPASARLGLLFLDIMARAKRAGIGTDDGCEFPVTQLDLADACGLTSVHVNRTLKTMRKAGIIDLRYRHLSILKADELRALVAFSPSPVDLVIETNLN